MMTRNSLDRRQAILGMGAALMILSAKQAVASDGDFAAREFVAAVVRGDHHSAAQGLAHSSRNTRAGLPAATTRGWQ